MALTTNEEEAMNHIMDACKIMGWTMAIKKGEEEVNGLTIGTEEYIDKILDRRDVIKQKINERMEYLRNSIKECHIEWQTANERGQNSIKAMHAALNMACGMELKFLEDLLKNF